MEKFLGYFVTLILISIVMAGSIEEDVEAETKKGKILNFFTVVRFPNSVCAGDTLNGTCYSAEECSSRGGVQSGTCAGGYGVCCTCKLLIWSCPSDPDFLILIVSLQLLPVVEMYPVKTIPISNQMEMKKVTAR